ncbi:MAG: hypothetical protein ABEJ83_00725, partial [Candidatus Nanohaloarchaea archaeon]
MSIFRCSPIKKNNEAINAENITLETISPRTKYERSAAPDTIARNSKSKLSPWIGIPKITSDAVKNLLSQLPDPLNVLPVTL